MRNIWRGAVAGAAALAIWPIGITAQQADTVTPARGQRAVVSAADRLHVPAPQGFSVVLVLGEMTGTGPAESVPPAARKALVDMKDFLPYKSYRLLDSQWTLCCGRSAIATRLRGPDEQDYELELDPGPSPTSGKWNVRFALREAGGSANASAAAAFADRSAALGAQWGELEAKLKQLKERYNDNHPEVRAVKEQMAAIEREQTKLRTEESMKRLRTASTPGYRRALIDTSFTMDIGETVVVGTSRVQGDKALIALLTAVASTKPTSTR